MRIHIFVKITNANSTAIDNFGSDESDALALLLLLRVVRLWRNKNNVKIEKLKAF
jgi:hypothetical protein